MRWRKRPKARASGGSCYRTESVGIAGRPRHPLGAGHLAPRTRQRHLVMDEVDRRVVGEFLEVLGLDRVLEHPLELRRAVGGRFDEELERIATGAQAERHGAALL